MSRTIRVGWSFFGENFGGTLTVPDAYLKPDGSIDERALRNRLSGNPSVTFGDDALIGLSNQQHRALLKKDAGVTTATREVETLLRDASQAADRLADLLKQAKQSTGKLSGVANDPGMIHMTPLRRSDLI